MVVTVDRPGWPGCLPSSFDQLSCKVFQQYSGSRIRSVDVIVKVGSLPFAGRAGGITSHGDSFLGFAQSLLIP